MQVMTASERSEALALMISHQPLKDSRTRPTPVSTWRAATAAAAGEVRGSAADSRRPRGVKAALDRMQPSARPLPPRRDLWLALAVS